MNTYRASDHVVLGVPNEHSYNMFLSFENICSRLGLWETSISWKKSQVAFHRLTQNMKNINIQRKRYAKEYLQNGPSSGG